ncbi:MAG: DUF1549 domain-containing protein, partial [Planctomycetaceae bacterium]|nr:DUF1549 domain-containing protein [Planctomycetaceae bacterium]
MNDHVPFRRRLPVRFLALTQAVAALCLGSWATAAEPQFPAEQIKYFETHIRPLLIGRCYKCHSEAKQSGELRLDSRAALIQGGESGPSFDAENPDASLFLEAIRYESFEMPPKGKLKDAEIELLTNWIQMGAPWPDEGQVTIARSPKAKISDEERSFWSFQPLTHPAVPALENDTWSTGAVDQFVLRKLRENDLTPAADAEQVTLVRRLYFDLIGLPPTPEELDEFLADKSPAAWERLVDKLLDSPRYGEHWARFWLDLVRYAESDGFRKDDYRPQAYRYRDYVIESLNNDKPYDEFVREQLAGDEIAPEDPHVLAATGFLRHGIYEYNQRDAVTQWQDMLND